MGALWSNLSGQHEKQGDFPCQKPIDVAIIGAGASSWRSRSPGTPRMSLSP